MDQIPLSRTLNCRGRLLDLSTPVVMGILNATPDSFFDGGRYVQTDDALRRAETMLNEGASLLDVGGASSRPGAPVVPVDEELQRVTPLIDALARRFPEALLSIDTWRAQVATEAIYAGAHLVNDVSAGRLDNADDFYAAVAALGVPYVLMHMQGTPATMQQQPRYEDVTTEVLDFFLAETARLRALGVADIVLDPGFGFGKTVAHNYRLLLDLPVFARVIGLPIMVGVSRKSMICKVLNVKPEHALNGTTALHMVALQGGASILRAHDVREAVQCVRLKKAMDEAQSNRQ